MQDKVEKGSREVAKTRREVEEIASIVVDTALQLHRDLGPGLLETVYEAVLANLLEQKGMQVERQKTVPIHYQGIEINEGFRLDLLVDRQLIVKLKSVENIHPVHPKQLLTYLAPDEPASRPANQFRRTAFERRPQACRQSS